MANDDQGEKTEEATESRREEFRRQGNVANTRELGGALIFLAAAGAVWVLGRYFYGSFTELFSKTLGADMVDTVRSGSPLDILQYAAGKTAMMVFPISFVAAVIGVISAVSQTGFMQVEDALTPKFEKLDPIAGLGRIFSLRGLMEGVKSVLKLTAVAIVVFLLLKSEVSKIPFLVASSPGEIVSYIGTILVRLLMGVGLVMIVISGADYLFQRWDLERKMMMTKEEVKQEIKQREGSPQVKQRIRQLQRDSARKRMMDAIPKADVVITNPTHIAIVLKYGENLPAPQIVAKGADLIAEKIKEIARQHNIPIIENKPLARTIFKTLKIGQVIPRELFVAVAEVLSYVYKLRRKKGRS